MALSKDRAALFALAKEHGVKIKLGMKDSQIKLLLAEAGVVLPGEGGPSFAQEPPGGAAAGASSPPAPAPIISILPALEGRALPLLVRCEDPAKAEATIPCARPFRFRDGLVGIGRSDQREALIEWGRDIWGKRWPQWLTVVDP